MRRLVVVDVDPAGIDVSQELGATPSRESSLREVHVEAERDRAQVLRQVLDRHRALVPAAVADRQTDVSDAGRAMENRHMGGGGVAGIGVERWKSGEGCQSAALQGESFTRHPPRW